MSKKRNGKSSSMIIMLLIVVIVIGAVGFYKSQTIWNSEKVTATVTKDVDSYVNRHKEKRKSNGKQRTYYIVEVYQDMEIEYELDGETFSKNTGFLEVHHSESRMSAGNDNITDKEYIDNYSYDVGDSIEVCITEDGDVYLGTEVSFDMRYYKYMFFAFGGLLLILIISKVIKRNHSDKE